MIQFELNFASKPTLAKGKRPKPEYPLNSVDHLRMLVDTEKQYMIYLYEQSPNLCFVRDHSFADNGTDYPITRKDAVKILGAKYTHHCNHVSHDGRKAEVYIRKESRGK